MVDANREMSPYGDGFVTDLLCNPGVCCQNGLSTGDAETNQEVALTNERPG